MEERELAIDWNVIWNYDRPAFVDQVLDRICRRLNHPFDAEGWKAVFRPLKRAWWSRVWILQEFVLGKDVVMQCGEDRLSWTGLSVNLTMATSPIQRQTIVPAGYTVESTLESVTGLIVQRYLYHNRDAEFSNRKALILALFDAAKRHTTDPHDYVHGILGPVGHLGQSLMRVDYSLPMRSLSTIIARQSMLIAPHSENDPVLTLIRKGGTSQQSPDFVTKIPCWVSEWSVLELKVSETLPSVFNASVEPQPTIYFLTAGLVLHVRGIFLDRQVSKYDVPWQPDDTRGA